MSYWRFEYHIDVSIVILIHPVSFWIINVKMDEHLKSSFQFSKTQLWHYSFCARYELSMRQACPFPYADDDDEVTLSCTESQYVNRARGKTVMHAMVTGLTPYTKYEFRLQVSNAAGQLETPVTASSVTLPSGMSCSWWHWCHSWDLMRLHPRNRRRWTWSISLVMKILILIFFQN